MRPTDIISNNILDKLESYLQPSGKIKTYVDKCVAHAATPESRDLFDFEVIKISFAELWEVHRILSVLIDFLARFILGSSYMILPLETPLFYQYWDEPIFPAGNELRLTTKFSDYRKETESWTKEIDLLA